jgi:putative holliday junction resolvase
MRPWNRPDVCYRHGRQKTRSLGLDVGDKRIGLAISDSDGILASPLTVIERREVGLDIEAITDVINARQVERVIVGLPRSMNGNLGPQAEKVKVFTESLGRKTSVPVEYRDERLTTVMAERLMHSTHSGSRRKNKGHPHRDAQAAALILQSYLDEGREMAPPPLN